MRGTARRRWRAAASTGWGCGATTRWSGRWTPAAGSPAWSTRIAAATRSVRDTGGYGPRSTPTVDGTLLYAEGLGGEVVCLEAASGELRWHKNLIADLGGILPRYGYSESLLVDGEKVIVTPGGPDATFAALNKETGEPLARAGARETRQPTLRPSPPTWMVCASTSSSSRRPGGGGGEGWRVPLALRSPGEPAGDQLLLPVYRDQVVFAASAYGTGGGAARLAGGPDGFDAERDLFQPRAPEPSRRDGAGGDYLYGTGVNSLIVRQLQDRRGRLGRPQRGQRLRHLRRRPAGPAQRARPGGRWSKPTRRSTWRRAASTSRTAPPAPPGPTLSSPAARLYLRDQDTLYCYDVKPKP